MYEFLNRRLPGLVKLLHLDTVQSFAAYLLVSVILFYALRTVRGLVIRYWGAFSARTSNELDDSLLEAANRTHFAFLATLALYIALPFGKHSSELRPFVSAAMMCVGLFQVARWVSTLVRFWIRNKITASGDPSLQSARGLLIFAGTVITWSTALLLLLSNLGFNISALLAGLGVGGVAVALAVQALLGDLLGNLAIVLDKPFEVGDFVIVGDFMGTIERVGVKTTRLRSIGGEQLVLSNADLVSSRLRNFKRMNERRVVLSIGVEYSTSVAQLRAMPELIESIISAQDSLRFERAHLNVMADSSLQYEIVYHVLTSDYAEHMDTKQEILLQILEAFESRSVAVAFPSRTVYLRDDNQQLTGTD